MRHVSLHRPVLAAPQIPVYALEESEYDNPLGISTGSAQIFGVTGGVMESALRTAYEAVTGKTLQKVDFEMVRGLEGVRSAVVPLRMLYFMHCLATSPFILVITNRKPVHQLTLHRLLRAALRTT